MIHKRLDIKPLQKDKLFGSVLQQKRQAEELEKQNEDKCKSRKLRPLSPKLEDTSQSISKKKAQLSDAIELSQQLQPCTTSSDFHHQHTTDITGKQSKYLFFRAVTEEEVSNAQASRLMKKYSRPTSAANRHVDGCTCETCVKQAKAASQIRNFKIVGNSKLVQNILEIHGMTKTDSCECNLLWSNQHLRSTIFKTMKRHQKINLFPRSFECTRKDALATNLNIMIETHGKKHFPFVPDCFVWPRERNAIIAAITKSNGKPWILKPAGSSQGKGVAIITRLSQLPSDGSGANHDDNWVVEKYIDNPLLMDGKKFDLRLYVCVTSFHPLKIYLHQEGLVRMATEPYSNESYDEAFVHLTNYSINRKNTVKYGVNKQARNRQTVTALTAENSDEDEDIVVGHSQRDDNGDYDDDNDDVGLGSRRPLRPPNKGIVSEGSLATSVPPIMANGDELEIKWGLRKFTELLQKMGANPGTADFIY